MTAQHPHAKLPDKATLEREYLAGASFGELAEKYGVARKTVYNTMVRRARKAGTTWPLKRERRPDWRKRAGEAHARARWDSVTAVMIRAELLECAATHGVSLTRIAELAGVNKNVVHQITAPKGRSKRISRANAQKVMHGVYAVERSAAISAGMARARKAS